MNQELGYETAIVGKWHLGPVSTIGDEETRYELFNLNRDPYEENNLVKENPLKFEELKNSHDYEKTLC